jgi:hypothetical protein
MGLCILPHTGRSGGVALSDRRATMGPNDARGTSSDSAHLLRFVWRESLKQLTAPTRVSVPLPVSTAAHLPPVTRFRDPDLPYEDLIMCERDCMRCSYAATLNCDGNCGVCPRQNYCPCVNPAKVRTKQNRLAEMAELPMVASLGRN